MPLFSFRLCFLTFFFYLFFALSYPSIRQAHHPHTQPLSSLHHNFTRPLFLTNLFGMFNSIRFVLWPPDFSQGHLCSWMFGVVLWSLKSSAVGRQDSHFTLRSFYPGRCSSVSGKAPCALPLLGLMVDIPRMEWSSVGWCWDCDGWVESRRWNLAALHSLITLHTSSSLFHGVSHALEWQVMHLV